MRGARSPSRDCTTRYAAACASASCSAPGYDTFAYRQPDWTDGVRVVEVDAPATQADKRERLREAGVAVPDNVAYAAIDFETTSLGDGLLAAGVDPSAPAFFSWLGVMMYLTRQANDAVLRDVASRPRESEIAFTFARPRPADEDALAERVAELGEPFRTRIAPSDLHAALRALGFRDVTIVRASFAAAIV